MSTLVAKQLSDIFRLADVERVYGVVGDRLNPSIDAIRRAEGIERVHVGNEEAVARPAPLRSPLPVAGVHGSRRFEVIITG